MLMPESAWETVAAQCFLTAGFALCSLRKASKSYMHCVFVSTDNEVQSCMDVDDGSSVEIADEFCYLVDMLSVDGDVDAAVTVRKTWKEVVDKDVDDLHLNLSDAWRRIIRGNWSDRSSDSDVES